MTTVNVLLSHLFIFRTIIDRNATGESSLLYHLKILHLLTPVKENRDGSHDPKLVEEGHIRRHEQQTEG